MAGAKPQRDAAHFMDRISDVRSAEDLVSDRRLLEVALGAFGLQDDLGNRAFIRKILSDGTSGQDALANRLADKRYRDLSAAFGLGPGETPKTGNPDMMQAVVDRWRRSAFEVAVGEQDETMRIALYAGHELANLGSGGLSEDAKWFTVMGQAPLRSLFETALGLPTSFGKIDIDQQLQILRDKTRAATGQETIAQFATEQGRERLINLYFARSQINSGTAGGSPAATALALLRASSA